MLGFGLALSAMIAANGASAQTTFSSVPFPVAELGNCKDKDACKTYCDATDHIDACLAFAEKNNLMSQDEIAMAKKFAAAGSKGPGGCAGKDACENYCDEVSHIDECVAFAEKTGMLPPEQLAEAKQVQAAIAKGVKPPACSGRKECDAYCSNASHAKECVAFGEASGFLKGKELEDAKNMLAAIDNGAVPPPCGNREACDSYCSEPDHIEACMTFAQAAGFMTPEEAQNSEKMIEAFKKGVQPLACKGKEACDSYCAEPAHTDECIQFSVAAGFMTAQDAEIARKTGGKGPGGCSSKEACTAFCGNPDNRQTCADFAKSAGIEVEGQGAAFFQPTPENGGTIAAMRVGACKTLDECKAYCESNPEECQKAGVPVTGDCVSGIPEYKEMSQCASYCKNHQELCALSRYNIQMLGGRQQSGGQGGNSEGPNGPNGGLQTGGAQGEFHGPGGCSTAEECQAYCAANPEACQGFAPPGGGPAYQTAPQSSNFDLNNSLTAVITAFREPKF